MSRARFGRPLVGIVVNVTFGVLPVLFEAIVMAA